MLDYDLTGPLMLFLFLLLGAVLMFYLCWPILAWLWRKKAHETPSKRTLKRVSLVLGFGIATIVLMTLFSHENHMLLDTLFILLIAVAAPILTVCAIAHYFCKIPESAPPTRPDATAPIRMPKYYLWIGILATGAMTALTLAAEMLQNETSAWYITLAFALFIPLGIFLILAYFNVHIILEEDYLIYRNILRRTRKVPYDSIERYRLTGRDITLYTDKKKYVFDREMSGGAEFPERIKSRVGVEKWDTSRKRRTKRR